VRGDDRGSTIPLILGCFILVGLMVSGAVAAGDAFVQQRGLQAVCDGAAAAAAAGAADLDRGSDLGSAGALRFAGAQDAAHDYLARDPDRAGVRVDAAVAADGTTIRLVCDETRRIVFGAVFGRSDGVRHVVRSSVRAPLVTTP
jgi:Flp pilus assembly protein TadG